MKSLIKVRKKTRKGFQKKDWPSQYLETISCLNCKSKSYIKPYPKTYRRIVSCNKCGLIYTNPRLKKRFLERLYSKEYFNNSNSDHFGYENYVGDQEKIIKTFSKRIKTIEELYGKKGKILDVGCATGFFLKAARDRNWKTEGVEVSKFATDYARTHYKFKIHQGNFLTLKITPNSYDIITLWDVIEHFHNPILALNKINKLLKPGGLLILSTPDAKSIPAKLTRERWVGYKLSDEHLGYFSRQTLESLLNNAGFSIVKDQHIGKHVSLNMLSNRASIYSPIFGKIITIMSKFFPKNYYLYINPFDIICIYAKKNS